MRTPISPMFPTLLLAVALAGCDDGNTTPGRDASGTPPSGEDASTPGTDAGSIPTPDAGSTPTPDAGSTPTPDSGSTPEPDAGGGESTSGADPRAGYVGCGETSCESPQVCCVSLSGQMCTGGSDCSGGFSAAGHCDGREDCGGGEACCVHFGMFDPENGAFCRSGGCPSDDNELCHTSAGCSGGETCVSCVPPTGGVLDVVYGICSSDGTCPSPYTMAP